MDIVKKNILSILCGVVALLAVVALFWPFGGYFQALQTQANQRKAQYDKADTLLKKQRHLPVINPGAADASSAPDLTMFPNPAVLDAGQKATDELKNQSTQIVDAAVAMNKHEQLVPGLLPNASGDRTPLFQSAYNDYFEKVVPSKRALDSATPPDDKQVQAEEAKVDKKWEDQIQRGPDGKEFNRPQIDEAKQGELAQLQERMRRDAAGQHKMYMYPEAMEISKALARSTSQAPTDQEVWYGQMALWVEQDVVNAIRDINAKSNSVAQSPVKQLEGLSIPTESSMYFPDPGPGSLGGTTATPVPGSTSGTDQPSTPTATTDTEPFPKNFTNNPTGRQSNPLYDVVHFTMTLDVDAAEVQSIISQLEKGRLITVYQTDIETVDSREARENGFEYGPRPVVKLTLQCEELFMRKWTKPLMPPSIRTLLKVPADEGTAQPAQQTASGQ